MVAGFGQRVLWRLGDVVIGVLAVFLMLVICWSVVFVVAYAGVQKRCLEAGYPRVEITWDLSGYCVTLDGDTRAVVEPL